MKKELLFALLAVFAAATVGGVEARTQSEQNFSIGRSLQHKPRKAIPYFTRAIKLNPNSGKAYLARGQAFLELDKKEFALADLNKAILLNVKDTLVFYLRGRLYFEAGKPNLALKDFERFAKLSSDKLDSASGYRNMGKVYYDLKEYDKAIVNLTKATELEDGSSNYWLRGNAYYQRGDYKLAINDFTTAINRKDTDDYAKYYSSRAKTYEKMGKKKLAKKDWHYVRESVKAGWGAFLDMEKK